MKNRKDIVPMYYKQILNSCESWSDAEFGAYVRLLWHQWDKGSIPDDIRRLKRIAESVERGHVALSKFEAREGGALVNVFGENVKAAYVRFKAKQAANGKQKKGHTQPASAKQVLPAIEFPTIDAFIEYGKELLGGQYGEGWKFSLTAKFESWKDAKWKDGHNKPIKNWKLKLKNTLPHLKPLSAAPSKDRAIATDYDTKL